LSNRLQRRKRLTSIWAELHRQSVHRPRDGPAKKTIGIRLPGEEEGGKKKKKSKAKKGSKKTKAQEKAAGKLISIDDDKIFEPTLQIIAGKGKVINDLRKAAITADAVYLAGDPDREGEAISAHLAMVLSKPAKYIEQEPSVSRFKKKDAKPEEPVKKEEETSPKKKSSRLTRKRFFASLHEITPKAIRAPSISPGR